MNRHPQIVLAIDPGPTRSAWVVLGPAGGLRSFAFWENERLLEALRNDEFSREIGQLVVEQVQSFGMTVGAEVFETVYWSGRFAEAARPLPVARIGRLAVKMALCHDSRAKDPNVRQALIDRYGGSTAIGRKAAPGPLYGVAGDVWSALAVGCAWQDGAR